MPTVKNDDNLGNAEIWEDSAMPNKEDIDNKGDQVIGNQTDAHISLRDAFKYYKSAILWSVIISNRIIMESYDLILMNHLYAFPAFQSTFGVHPTKGTWSISSPWQILLSMLVNIGLGIDRWSPRIVMMISHVPVAEFVFTLSLAECIDVTRIGTKERHAVCAAGHLGEGQARTPYGAENHEEQEHAWRRSLADKGCKLIS